jgi:PAS domain S-box-containing protein
MPRPGPTNVASSESGGLPFAGARITHKGPMGDRIRAHDWASTPPGPLHQWSTELVSIVNMILACPTPARILWGPDLILIYNDSYSSVPGRRHPHALGKPAREVFQEVWHLVGPVLQTAFTTGEPFVFDKRRVPVETDEGMKEFYLHCTYSPIFENGKVAGLLGLFHDVTGEVKNALDLEGRLNVVRQTSLSPICVLTPEGVAVECNRAWLDMTGGSRTELSSTQLPDFPRLAAAPGVPGLLRNAVAAAGRGETVRQELAFTEPERGDCTFDLSLQPVRDDRGQIIHLVAEARDITAEKRMHDALLKSEKLAAVGRLASSIAHEINNPLESVMNLIYLARNASPADAGKFLDLADQEIRRVSIIANQTLRFHKQAAKPQAATAADLFSTVMSIHEGRLRNAHIQVEKRFDTDQPVTCYPGDVRQVLNNLVANAIEAMPFGGRLVIGSRLGHDWRTNRRGLLLVIADNGSGIPPQVMKRIYDAFFTTKGAAGNGLGLWVCAEIVGRHHGRLRVRSTQRPGRHGTTFTLFLPFDSACT